MPGPSLPALRLLFSEAKDVVRAQASIAEGLDDKAAQLARFNLILLGLLVTAATFLSDPRTGLVLPWTASWGSLTGFVLLVVSTVAATVGYWVTDLQVGLQAEELVDALSYDAQEAELLREAVRAYGQGMVKNSRSVNRTATALQLALVAVLHGLVCLTVSAIVLLLPTLT